jgi:hypothetical protein
VGMGETNDIPTPPNTPVDADLLNSTDDDQNSTDDDDNNEHPDIEIVRPPIENHFVLELFQSKSFKKSQDVKEMTYRVKLKHPSDKVPITHLLPQLEGLFNSLIDEIRHEFGNHGVARIFIQHPNLERPIIIIPTELGLLNVDDIMEYIERVVNSAGEIPADDKLQINVAVIKALQGKGRRRITNVKVDTKLKKSCIVIPPGNACLPRAIYLGYKHLEYKKDKTNQEKKKEYDKIRNYSNLTGHRCGVKLL